MTRCCQGSDEQGVWAREPWEVRAELQFPLCLEASGGAFLRGLGYGTHSSDGFLGSAAVISRPAYPTRVESQEGVKYLVLMRTQLCGTLFVC